ncbi:hypothetical protein CEXT_702981 [Caerostris extrusa]|uniref:Uncharacterized protein n=1 Tax=Caerostris extrusa TaxID=172846 RepID=A0AAV4WB22_CAEEX|nr:hypothetical protein CEXT_702981 [Caerostris extrusa]
MQGSLLPTLGPAGSETDFCYSGSTFPKTPKGRRCHLLSDDIDPIWFIRDIPTPSPHYHMFGGVQWTLQPPPSITRAGRNCHSNSEVDYYTACIYYKV